MKISTNDVQSVTERKMYVPRTHNSDVKDHMQAYSPSPKKSSFNNHTNRADTMGNLSGNKGFNVYRDFSEKSSNDFSSKVKTYISTSPDKGKKKTVLLVKKAFVDKNGELIEDQITSNDLTHSE